MSKTGNRFPYGISCAHGVSGFRNKVKRQRVPYLTTGGCGDGPGGGHPVAAEAVLSFLPRLPRLLLPVR
jgi:hypothetical protein